ncbi:hypothetical protein HELRODRAFT_160241 [Helobdella robusta]|uniref:Uncharacterized protein n=1 Tax=Helobdella robusta TaxID=6412 RepID=T1EQ06_HELRO|nr:hypothetical protein HELRODRAFT_160241 [Helobdella robusta]ESO06105.1 hypothetical protein HELRODRAFT_160241 [Helobdella robusta]
MAATFIPVFFPSSFFIIALFVSVQIHYNAISNNLIIQLARKERKKNPKKLSDRLKQNATSTQTSAKLSINNEEIFLSNTSAQQNVEDDYTQPAKKVSSDPFANLLDGCSSSTNEISTAKPSGHEELGRYKAVDLLDECYAFLPVQHNLRCSIKSLHGKLKKWN